MEILAVLTTILTLFWLVVGWRAMRAHENIALEMRRIAGSIGDMADTARRSG